MKQIEVKTEITAKWWRTDGKPIDAKYVLQLTEEAEKRVKEMREESFTSGELCAEIDTIEYSGWWEFNILTN